MQILGNSSQDFFSAFVFLREKVKTEKTIVAIQTFVIVETHVTAMKAITSLKLDLKAVALSSRLRVEIPCALTMQVERISMWTDSITVLQWLQSSDKQLVFSANCVAEALRMLKVAEGIHFQNANNPADASTRGLAACALLERNGLENSDFLEHRNGFLGHLLK